MLVILHIIKHGKKGQLQACDCGEQDRQRGYLWDGVKASPAREEADHQEDVKKEHGEAS